MFPPNPLRGLFRSRQPLQDARHAPAGLPAGARARASTSETTGPAPGNGERSHRASLALAAGLVGLVVLSYWPALRGGLLWDDDGHLTRPELRSWDGLGRIWTDLTATQQYYPVLHSAFWLEHRLWGEATLPYHLLNVGLHALASLLFVAALQRLWAGRGSFEFRTPSFEFPVSNSQSHPHGGCSGHPGSAKTPPLDGTRDSKPETENAARSAAAWLAGFLFAVHPVAVESVAWISEQKNTLSLVFYFGAGLAYLRFDRTRSYWTYGAAFVLYALALGTKSVTATLPAALLVMLWWQRGALSWRRDVLPLAPWLALGIGAGLFTAWVEYNFIGANGGEFELAWWQRVLLASRVIGFYVGKLLWPADLMFIYPHWDVAASGAVWVGWLLGVFALTFAFWRVRQRNRGLLAGWLFFVGSLVPALGFVNVYPFRYSYVADHFQYLPSLGVIALCAAGLALAWSRWVSPLYGNRPESAVPGRPASRGISRGLVVLGLVIIPVLALLTYRQAHQYRDVETLFRATLARNPGCWMAHLNLGVHLAKTPETKPEAIEHFRATLRLRPLSAEAHYNLANELTRTGGDRAQAVEHYTRAIALKPDYAEAHNNLALELQGIAGRESEAVAHFETALRINPAHAKAHNNLGYLLSILPGRLDEAISHFEAALRLQPEFVMARLNLARALSFTPRRFADAEVEFRRVLQLQPDSAEAHHGLANLLVQQPGRTNEALPHYERALRLRPDAADAHNDLGILHARQGRFDEAERLWTRALQLDGTLVHARRNLERLRAQFRR